MEDKDSTKELCLVIDNNVLKDYEKHYFSIHTKARNKPIKAPYHPSINEWIVMRRPMMNDLKQKWKTFIVWYVAYKGYDTLNINKCEMTFVAYYKNNRRHDTDNSTPKFILDGFVEGGLLVDDDSLHIESLKLICKVDKDNPRTEIYIKILED